MDSRFKQEDAWRYLKNNGPKTSAEVAKRFGIKSHAACHLLYRMEKRGCVKRQAAPRRTTWTAIGSAPASMSGFSVRSMENLKKGWPIWDQAMHMANIARGVSLPFPRKRLSGVVIHSIRDGKISEVPRLPTLADILGM